MLSPGREANAITVSFQQSLWKMERTLPDNHSEIDPFALIGEMADLLAQHKLLPFLEPGYPGNTWE